MNYRKSGSQIWGTLLILIGLVLLADNLGVLEQWEIPVASLILGSISLVFLGVFVHDHEHWWALIPGMVTGVIAVAVLAAERGLIADYVVGASIVGGVGLPFLLIFLLDRDHWWALIPGMTMIGIAAAIFLEGIGVIGGPATGGLIVGGVALGFLSIYLVDRQQWWALIPGGATGIVAFFLMLAAASRFIWPVAIILTGLLMLRGSLRGGGRPRQVTHEPPPPIDTAELDRAVDAARPERLPTLEEQIEAALAEEEPSEPPPLSPDEER